MATDKPDSTLTFGEALRGARLRAGLTQAQLSEAAHLSRRTIIRWEAGTVSPWIYELRGALDALGLEGLEANRLLGLLETNRGQLASDPASAVRRARLLKMARMRAGIHPEELAKSMECTPSTVFRWESGRLCPKLTEFKRLWKALDVTPNEVAEFDMPLPLSEGKVDVVQAYRHDEKDAFGLFDSRFLRLIEQTAAPSNLDNPALEGARVKTAYAWTLSVGRRYEEALRYASEAISLFESGELPPLPCFSVATLAAARSSCNEPSERAFRRGIRLLDGLDRRPLDSELLACRLDAYAEAYANKGHYAKALKQSDRAIKAASNRHPRLARMLGFNRVRILLMSGVPEEALENLPKFSELTPLVDAGETLLVAQVLEALGRTDEAIHWRGTAQRIVQTYGLQRALSRDPNGVWSQPDLLASL